MLGWIVLALVLLAVVIAGACFVLAFLRPPRSPDAIEGSGFVRAHGCAIYDEKGKKLLLRGVNLGNWLLQEFWMNTSAVYGKPYTKRRAYFELRNNANVTEEQAEELENLYEDNFITEADFERIAGLGLNCVRVVLSYMNFLTADGKSYRFGDREKAFARLDGILGLCEKYGLYAILDMHGAPGSQNMDHHSGDDEHFDLFGNAENERILLSLWRDIARRYRGRTVVAGYDLLNEPRRAPHKYGGRRTFDFYDRLYRAVREEDPDHMIFVECFTFPVHGARAARYGWENVCVEYHIYNLTPFPQRACLRFYKALHNFMGYKMPVYIGEFNAWGREKTWESTLDFFESQGWSFTSWTYKTNARLYKNGIIFKHPKLCAGWGVLELDLPSVDLSTATYEEIRENYEQIGSENAEPGVPYAVYERRYAASRRPARKRGGRRTARRA